MALDAAQPKPAYSIRRPEPAGCDARRLRNYFLRALHFRLDEAGRLEREQRMRVGMVADLVTRRRDGGRHPRMALDIRPAQKERGRRPLFRQNLQQAERAGCGTVIEG